MRQSKKSVVYSIIMSMVFGMLFQFSGFLTKPAYAEEMVVRGKGELTTPGVITLDDVQKTLRAALGIIELEGEELWAADLYDNNEITLDNVRIILKAALGIIKISDIIPPVEEPTVPAIDYSDIFCQAIDSYGVYCSGNFMNIQLSSPNQYEGVLEKIVNHYEKRGIEVTTLTFEEMKEQGMIKDSAMYWWTTDGALVSLRSIVVSETEIVIEGGVAYSGLSGKGYRTTFVIKDGHWVLEESKLVMVA